MKKALALVVPLLVLLLPATACYGAMSGSGNLETREFDYDSFSRIEVGSAFDVEIMPSLEYSVRITLDDNLFDNLVVTRSGDTLKIGLRLGYVYSNYTARAEISLPELHHLGLSGATIGTARGFGSAEPFSAAISGASHLDIELTTDAGLDISLSGASTLFGSLTAGGDASFDLSGASSVEVSGAAANLDVSASGASGAELDGFTVGDADVHFSGASSGSLYVDGMLDAHLSGASHLYYRGTAVLGDVNASGGSGLSRR